MTAMFFCRRAVCVWLPLIAAALLLGAAGVAIALLCVLVADCAACSLTEPEGARR